MATSLDKALKRRITVNGAEYTVVIDPDGMQLVGKGRRKPDVELRWHDLLSGDAAMAVALNASLWTKLHRAAAPASAEGEIPAAKPGNRRGRTTRA